MPTAFRKISYCSKHVHCTSYMTSSKTTWLSEGKHDCKSAVVTSLDSEYILQYYISDHGWNNPVLTEQACLICQTVPKTPKSVESEHFYSFTRSTRKHSFWKANSFYTATCQAIYSTVSLQKSNTAWTTFQAVPVKAKSLRQCCFYMFSNV